MIGDAAGSEVEGESRLPVWCAGIYLHLDTGDYLTRGFLAMWLIAQNTS